MDTELLRSLVVGEIQKNSGKLFVCREASFTVSTAFFFKTVKNVENNAERSVIATLLYVYRLVLLRLTLCIN